MAELWTIKEIVQAVGGVCSLPASEQAMAVIDSVSIDSRSLDDGALYVAITGVSQDGHKYVGAAFVAGAEAALVRHDFEGADFDSAGNGLLIKVDEPLAALEDLARAARARTSAKVIAVTGSAGKTGTKEALKVMLAQSGETHASVKSFNNQWGVPLSLARMPRDCAYGVFEVGMNHAGEISPLSKLIQPDVALITTVAPVHIGHFSSEEEIADAKAEIFDGLGTTGVAVLPVDNRHFGRLVARARAAGVSRVVGFGKELSAPETGTEARMTAADFDSEGSRVTAEIFDEAVDFSLAQPGEHIAINMIGALATVKLVGGDLHSAASCLARLAPAEGRGVRYELRVDGGTALLIDESYNANPASMEIALRQLSAMRSDAYSRRIAVLGDMLELGTRSRAYHDQLSPLIGALDIDFVFAAGEMMGSMYDSLLPAKQASNRNSSADLVKDLQELIQPGDVIMIKGSLGSDMGLIVEALKATYGGV